jgi:hypothetical protein
VFYNSIEYKIRVYSIYTHVYKCHFCRKHQGMVPWRFIYRLEEGFCVFRNGLISISDWVFGNVWSCSTVFIMKTSHKRDELKKGGVHKSGTYASFKGWQVKRTEFNWLTQSICKWYNYQRKVHSDTWIQISGENRHLNSLDVTRIMDSSQFYGRF